MKDLNKLGKVITKIVEVFHWVGATLMLAAAICSVAAPDWLGYFVGLDAKECCGADLAETSVNMSGIFMGIIVLCLTQFFVHGAELEKDVDGLL